MSTRFVKKLTALNLLVIFFGVHFTTNMFAQCNPVGGTAGIIYNTNMTDSVSFTVTISPTCSFTNLGAFTGVCGLTFPGIITAWSGNTNGSTSTITYSFTKPVTNVDLMIGYTGVNGVIAPESFTFTTNTVVPGIAVFSGTCSPWTINGNQTTSPNIIGGLNSIHSIFSPSPFTSLTITTNSSGSGTGANGGSSFALCSVDFSTGIYSPYGDVIQVYPNPSFGNIYIDLTNTPLSRSKNILYIYDAFGSVVRTFPISNSDNVVKIVVEDLAQGIYFLKYQSGENMFSKKIIIQDPY